MLRLVSFGMDYHWAKLKVAPPTDVRIPKMSALTKSNIPSSQVATNLTEKQRQTSPHPEEMYSFVTYVAYTLYSPLYIAGPIMTFNDFLWQASFILTLTFQFFLHHNLQHRQPAAIPHRAVAGYLGRFLASLLTMELILHFMYVVAIKDMKAWVGDTPAQISMIGLWNLVIMWLKVRFLYLCPRTHSIK